jgi:hypothetical protein
MRLVTVEDTLGASRIAEKINLGYRSPTMNLERSEDSRRMTGKNCGNCINAVFGPPSVSDGYKGFCQIATSILFKANHNIPWPLVYSDNEAAECKHWQPRAKEGESEE